MILGFVVGLQAEARMLKAPVAVSGGTRIGADRAAAGLIAEGVDGLVSFGLAAGLDPSLRAGDILVPRSVLADGEEFASDPLLSARLGVPRARLLHSDLVVAKASEKQALHLQTGCAAVDMESGAVAIAARTAGLPFAVLRSICDPADQDLPPAALLAMRSDGGLALGRIVGSLLGAPGQLPALLALARNAASARRALARKVRAAPG